MLFSFLFLAEETRMHSRLGVMISDLWIVSVEGESDWNDYNVCLSGLSSLYAKDELSISIFRVSLSRAVSPYI